MAYLRTLVAALCLWPALNNAALAFDVQAGSAFVKDMNTGTVLLKKNADVPLPPASMSKLMTLYVTFEAIREGRLTLDEELSVSEHAMSFGGSTMFLDTTDRVSVEDLLRGIIVLSGNDACVVLAEALSPDGTEVGFARFMTERARQMGMNQSVFLNSSGWPEEGHVMSMRDLGILAERIIVDFPEYYPMFAETEFAFDGRAPKNVRNRNPLLELDIGADGLKTGHTQEAGYGLVGSAIQGDRRVIFVVSGIDTVAQRARETEALINWSFRQFTEAKIASAGEEVSRADVWMGSAGTVGLAPAEDLVTMIPILSSGPLAAEIVYNGPIEAPIEAGAPIAEMVISPEGMPEMRVPLLASEAVSRGGFGVRLKTVSGLLFRRALQGVVEEADQSDGQGSDSEEAGDAS
ncbi:MAG: D-alanyl-D-alanine carboxypeptidase family protein [Pseudomonadota bacterium]